MLRGGGGLNPPTILTNPALEVMTNIKTDRQTNMTNTILNSKTFLCKLPRFREQEKINFEVTKYPLVNMLRMISYDFAMEEVRLSLSLSCFIRSYAFTVCSINVSVKV